MQRIQVMLDDRIANVLKQQAHDAGISISSYARILLNDKLNKKRLSVMEQAMLDLDSTEGDVHCSGQAFLDQLEKMIKDA